MKISQVLPYEIVHWNDEKLFIAHKADRITYIRNGQKREIRIPSQSLGWKKLFLFFRKARRALRIDRTMILPNRIGFVAICNRHIYIYNDEKNLWAESNMVLNCRNPMYNGVLNVDGTLYIGEYGNPNGFGKRILMSQDDGFTWKCAHQFKPDEIRHIHALLWDKYEQKIWIFTGDFNPEPQVFKADREFKEIERVGGGTQQWRACHAIFSERYVDWMMDCPLEDVHHIRYDRESGQIYMGQLFAGPIWFAQQYGDWIYAASAQEIGPSHKDDKIHVYRSKNLENWDEIAVFDYDGWPKRYFRFGIITTARGKDVMLCCEGIKRYDGKTIWVENEDKNTEDRSCLHSKIKRL